MKKKMSFDDYKKEVETQLKKQYGLDLNDTGLEESLKEDFESGVEVQELLDNNATKYELDRIDE